MKTITQENAERLIEFAIKHNAMVEQKKFKNFDRCIVLTVRGTVGLRVNHNNKSYELEDFHGFNNKMDELKNKHTAVRIDGYHG